MRNFTFILLFNLLRLYSLLCMEKAEGSSGGGLPPQLHSLFPSTFNIQKDDNRLRQEFERLEKEIGRIINSIYEKEMELINCRTILRGIHPNDVDNINYYTNHENVLIFALKNLHRECQENKVMQSGILKRIEENYIYMMRHQSKEGSHQQQTGNVNTGNNHQQGGGHNEGGNFLNLNLTLGGSYSTQPHHGQTLNQEGN
ncbi:hypothetical protein ACQ4LE_000750 [Meloidogyne hapla]